MENLRRVGRGVRRGVRRLPLLGLGPAQGAGGDRLGRRRPVDAVGRRGRAAARRRPGAGRVPELLLPVGGALSRARAQPRALLPRAPDPGGDRARAHDRPPRHPRRRMPVRGPDRARRAGLARGPPRAGDGAGRAVPRDRARGVPRARRADGRPARARAARRDGVPARPRAGPRGDRGGRATPCASSTWPAGSSTCTSRPATRRCWRRCGRSGTSVRREKAYVTGGLGSRESGEAFGDAVRTAAGDRIRGDVRGDRGVHVQLADAAGDRRGALRGRDGARALQRDRRRCGGGRTRRSSTRTRSSRAAGSRASRGTRAAAARRTSPASSRRFSTTWRPATSWSIQLHLLGAGRISSAAAELDVETAYPWDGRVEITVRRPVEGFELAVRIPEWCREATIAVAEGDPPRRRRGRRQGESARRAPAWRRAAKPPFAGLRL